MSLQVSELRKKFPQIKHLDAAKEVYLDSAATTLKFDFVIDCFADIYKSQVSNVHRGEHHLSLAATSNYEKAREQAAEFLNAKSSSEIVFTSGTTYGINFLANTLSSQLQQDDEILISEMEHHSNLLPWKVLADQKNIKLKFIEVNPDGTLNLESFKSLLSSKTKILSVTHVSNVTGVINPIEQMAAQAKAQGAYVIVDAAQSASCLNLDVQKLGCDFLVFSGHKIFAPSGIGILFGRQELLSKLPPFLVGGGMITEVSFDKVKWASSPYTYEAGTPFIEGAIALGKVLSFFRENIDCQQILEHEKHLVDMAATELSQIPNLKVIGSPSNRSNILSFEIEGLNSSDISFIMAEQKIALRAGHHCCMPLMKRLNLKSGAIRASFSIYNTEQDVLVLKKAVLKVIDILGEG